MHNLIARIPALSLQDESWTGLAPNILTASFDIRHSGYKIAPVDANLFPAGWHQLCKTSHVVILQRLRAWVSHHAISVDTQIVLLAESFTRNAPYLENIFVLRELLAQVFSEVRVAMYLDALPQAGYDFQTTRGTLHVDRYEDRDGEVYLGGSAWGDLLVLATDLSRGMEFLQGVTLPMYPDPAHGWHARSKETFFKLYNPVAAQWAEDIGIDPWSVTVDTEVVAVQSLSEQKDIETLAAAVQTMLAQIQEAYSARGVSDAPFVVMKAAAGTFGRGVLMLGDAAELGTLSKKARKSLVQSIPGSDGTMRFLIQEGIYTRDIVKDCPSEPVVYAMGGAAVGGFYRSHCGKDPSTNLNAPGMVFAAMCADEEQIDEVAPGTAEQQAMYYAVAQQAIRALDREVSGATGA